MFGWGKRRGSEGRVRNNNVYLDGERPARRAQPGHAAPEVTEVIVYVPTPRPITELAIIIAFTVGLAITAEAVLLALAVQFGTGNPLEINVDHIKSCLSSDDISLAAQAQQMLPLKDSDRAPRRDEGGLSSITVYVPCDADTGSGPYDGRDGRDRRDGRDDRGGLGSRSGSGRSQ